MGLFSSKKTTQTTQNVYETTNQNLQAQGPAILGTGNALSVVSTDYRAIEQAAQISRDAIAAQQRATVDAFDAATYTADLMRLNSRDALDFGRYALDTAETSARAALDAITAGNREALIFAEQSSRGALAWADSASRADATVLTEKIFRYGAIAAAVIAAAYLWGDGK